MSKTGAQILVDCLEALGSTKAFGVPGESYLAVLDALYDSSIDFVTCRQEGGAAMSAEAFGKLTGEPGICMVTRGPGATNASAGVHVAYQDSTPMILFIGQVGRSMVEREAFQEIDYRRMFGQMTKWVAQIDDAARIPEFISHAFHCATNGRPGPVVLALPEDMLRDVVEKYDIPTSYNRAAPAPSPDEFAQLSERLQKAERPLMIVGGGNWSADCAKGIAVFAEQNNLPVATSFRCQDYINNDHPNYAGHVGIGIDPKLAEKIKQSDLLILFGTRLGEMASNGYSLLDIPCPKQEVVHIHTSAEELGRVYNVGLAINCAPKTLIAMLKEKGQICTRSTTEWVATCRSGYDAFLDVAQVASHVELKEIITQTRDALDDDAIVTNCAGNYAIWLHRFFKYRDYRTQLAPTSGSMGYGVPAAVAAASANPDKQVICFAGDGGFMMICQELATAVQHDMNMTVVIVNNAMYGTIRMHQERNYPERTSGTDLKNPDFVAMAKAFGASGELVTKTEDYAGALVRALSHKGVSVIEIQTDPNVITPVADIASLRKK
ncbi:MAG: thiamine pyrophosphate-binding protein [Methylocystaceae bacterium]|nr:thiamine pyrophosphate-binding protein [Methylocystaceae bacterium]